MHGFSLRNPAAIKVYPGKQTPMHGRSLSRTRHSDGRCRDDDFYHIVDFAHKLEGLRIGNMKRLKSLKALVCLASITICSDDAKRDKQGGIGKDHVLRRFNNRLSGNY
ncbi:hypothetical protein ACO22_04059 [Paracoccidioides brasiliensis]|uniref:Uncharacterized protein n=1 Tax=Paracoccidioides brasiliensis TaxID=121759 RepID=A0A1D2JEA2_PARBR|nr:hypothetical protein ACO22_04059 [Paracoccidioides brasiliensis]